MDLDRISAGIEHGSLGQQLLGVVLADRGATGADRGLDRLRTEALGDRQDRNGIVATGRPNPLPDEAERDGDAFGVQPGHAGTSGRPPRSHHVTLRVGPHTMRETRILTSRAPPDPLDRQRAPQAARTASGTSSASCPDDVDDVIRDESQPTPRATRSSSATPNVVTAGLDRRTEHGADHRLA